MGRSLNVSDSLVGFGRALSSSSNPKTNQLALHLLIFFGGLD